MHQDQSREGGRGRLGIHKAQKGRAAAAPTGQWPRFHFLLKGSTSMQTILHQQNLLISPSSCNPFASLCWFDHKPDHTV